MSISPGPWKWKDKNGWPGLETADGEDLLLYAICMKGDYPVTKTMDWHSRVIVDREDDRAAIGAVPELVAVAAAAKELLVCIPNWAHDAAYVQKKHDALQAALEALDKRLTERN